MIAIHARWHLAVFASALLLISGLVIFDASAAMLVVNGIADASPPALSDGVCSLREAMQAIINASNFGDCLNSGGAYGTSDKVNFNISGTGVHTINVVASLPVITSPMLIDGYSQPGASTNTLAVGNDAQLKIEINGGLIHDASEELFKLRGGGGSTIRGLVLDNFAGTIIDIGFLQPSASNTIAGNFVGVDPTGTTFVNGANHTVMTIFGSAANTIGGTAPADRNVVTSQGSDAIGVYFGSGNLIQGNYIGVNAAGTAAVPAGGSKYAIELNGSGSGTVGGSAPGAGNVIVASDIGILVDGGSTNTTIQGNFIGTNAAGTAALGNAIGIQIGGGGSSGTAVGGPVTGEGNLISGGSIGIYVINGTTGAMILGNRIGTDVTGTSAIGNGQCGIFVAPGLAGAGIHIGGTGAGQGNIIAFNATQGVVISNGTGTLVEHNSIFSNGGLGISYTSRCDIPITTPTPNDIGDADTGANDLQNYPVITSAQRVGSNATISGTLNTAPSSAVHLEFFASAVCDASGNGEGQTYLGFMDGTTDSSGNIGFGPLSFPVPAGQPVMTATATGPGNNTSEFSKCLALPGAPVLQSARSRKTHGGAGPFDLPLAP
jgi:hypothetical protein